MTARRTLASIAATIVLAGVGTHMIVNNEWVAGSLDTLDCAASGDPLACGRRIGEEPTPEPETAAGYEPTGRTFGHVELWWPDDKAFD